MTGAEIINLAREAGVIDRSPSVKVGPAMMHAIGLFAALVESAEREACAEVCDAIHADKWALYKGRPPYTGAEDGRADNAVQGVADGADMCAEAIRARGK